MTKECWWVAEIDSAGIFYEGAPVNQVISSQVNSTSNPMYDWGTVGTVGMYLAATATLSGGLFRLGVWDSGGDPKATSAQFTTEDLVAGSDFNDCEEFLKSLTSTTTIDNGDSVGIIANEQPTGTGSVFIAGDVAGSTIPYWNRHIFIQGSTGAVSATKIITCCLSTDFTPPSTAAKIFSPPLSKSNVNIIPREFK